MKQLFITLALALVTTMSFAQVGIGTKTPDASAILDINVDNLPANAKKGLLPPRMSTGERDAIASPAEGLTIYNNTNGCLEFFNASLWVSACDGSLQPGPLSDCSTAGFIAPFITASQTEIVDVNAAGHTWMDRNLGAITAARASNDCYAYGNLHQWGRGNDGHESRTSNTTAGSVAAGSEGSNFITVTSNNGWLITPDATRWNGATKGVHDPCPAGYRVPTEAELIDLDASFVTQNRAGAFGSPLKLPAAGFRDDNIGSVFNIGFLGAYSSSSVSDLTLTSSLSFDGSSSNMNTSTRASGYSVRCIKN